MNRLKVIQQGKELAIENNDLPSQFSANIDIEFVMDNAFVDYIVIPSVRYGSETKALPYNDGIVKLPKQVFKQDGTIYLAFLLDNGKEQFNTNQIEIYIDESAGGTNVLPEDEKVWTVVVVNAVDQYMNIKYIDILDKLIENNTSLYEKTEKLQKAVNEVIGVINKKLENNDFTPKHKWEGDILFFSNPDNSWDEGFKVPGLDALNWKTATCVENATYKANIENWGTIKNALLAITFNNALDNTKPVILKINDEEEHPIFSNTEAMLGEELENKSTILRFDGSKWLVQTSQSGTIQSSDKSVKDIVTVTREELNTLQNNGQLVEGTLYQTVEPAEELNINKDAFITLTQTSPHTISTTKTEHPTVAISNAQGDCFEFVGNKILIKKGVTKVRVSTYAYFSTVSSGVKYVNTYVNGNRINLNYQKADTGITLSSTSVIVDVKEGDFVYHGVTGAINDIVTTSFITVEVVGKDYTLGNVSALVKEVTELKDYIANNKIESGGGYIKYPDGTLICYGKSVALANVKECNVTFPISFINSPIINFTGTWSSGYECYGSVGAVTTKTAELILIEKNNGFTKGRGAYWQAIGRWK